METSPILILLLGLGLTYVGFGPLSRKRDPTAGDGVAVIGFLARLAGMLLVIVGGLLWLFVTFGEFPG